MRICVNDGWRIFTLAHLTDGCVTSSKVLLTHNLHLGLSLLKQIKQSPPSRSFWSKMGNAGESGS